MATLGDLDLVLLRLPPDPEEAITDEVARIVMSLRTADEAFADGNPRGGMQALDLASARLRRLAAMLPENPPPDVPPERSPQGPPAGPSPP